LYLFFYNGYDFTALISTTVKAYMMRKLWFVTLRA